MVSSMLTGEKRWVSARRGGMTVLGKVTVPKPVNLPSQRLENHGLDPTVEIVPKGTLSWGSRSSSSASNAWGSSSLSPPVNDGSASSPSPLTGRPSSGGTGTRPSTAGSSSERSHEPVSSAWGSNSRPSSASGVLASNQTSALSTRPRSAETRSGSSQLSRFGETVAETSVAWGGLRTAEQLGTASSKHDDFTLSSGDFPSLRSEKSLEPARQGHSSHGRPPSSDSASQRERLGTPPTGDSRVDSSTEKGVVNTWRREFSPQASVKNSSVEKWQRDPQQAQPYPNMNMHPHHFDPWHGAPIRNAPEGVWYRGTPGPYRPAVPPGGYPLESFVYYPSQLPSRPSSNAQAGPRPGSSPNAYHPKSGDAYRPQTPDHFVVPSHPMIPVRPGFYPSPVPYEGYYGPPRMNFCNSSEQDPSPIGLAGGPYFCNPSQNVQPDSGNFHFRPGGYSPNSMISKDPMESTQLNNTCQGPYKVLLKQHESIGGNDGNDAEKRETAVKPMTQNDEESDCRRPTDMSKSAVGESCPPPSIDGKEQSVPAVGPSTDSTSRAKAVSDGLIKKPETACGLAEPPDHCPVLKKGPTLMDKIEGLNTKARMSEGRGEASSASTKEKAKQFGSGNDNRTSESSNIADNKSVSDCRVLSSTNEVVDVSAQGKYPELAIGEIVTSRQIESRSSAVSKMHCSDAGEKSQPQIQKRVHGMQGRTDIRGRGRFNIQDGEEWKRKSLAIDSSAYSVKNTEAFHDVLVQDHSNQEAEKQEPNHPGKAGGSLYVTSTFDSTDYQAQRAKMKEIATQRAKQLQKEEEERNREQKAKALAKLEELNRRTLAENITQKSESELPQSAPDEVPGSVACSKSDAMAQTEPSVSKAKEDLDHFDPCPAAATHLSVALSQGDNLIECAVGQVSSLVQNNNVSKQKQMVHKRKQHSSHERNSGEKTLAFGGTKVHDYVGVTADSAGTELSFGSIPSSNDDTPVQQKKKSSRGTKYKQKVDEVSGSVDSAPASSEGDNVKAFDESVKPKITEANAAQSLIVRETVENRDSRTVSDFYNVSADQGWSQQTEEVHSKMNNHCKPQPSRRMSKAAQNFRPAEKYHGNEGAVWAPVRPAQSKNVPFDAVETLAGGDDGHSFGNNSSGLMNSSKGKRADIERYVPKPVAKELSQQNFQNPSTLTDQGTTEEVKGKGDHSSETYSSVGRADNLAVANMDSLVVRKNGESKYSKNGRQHASWRQRGSVETFVSSQNIREDSSSDVQKTSQKPSEQQQAYSPKGHASKSSDNWNSKNSAPSELAGAPVIVTNHAVAGKGKRHLSKAHRVVGHSHIHGDNKDVGVVVTKKVDLAVSISESGKVDGSSLRIESQGVSENVSSHWQPKSQAISTHSQQGRIGGGGQRVTVKAVGIPEKDLSSPGTAHIGVEVEEKNVQVQPQTKPSEAQRSVPGLTNKSGRKGVDTFKEHINTSNEDPHSTAELAIEDVDTTHHEQKIVSPGQRRQGRHTGRFNRGQEATYVVQGGIQGQDTNKQRLTTVGDRRKHNSHYEYQPVGSYNKGIDSFHRTAPVGEEARDGMGLRYQERGQNQSRRGGHFSGRNSGGAAGVITRGNGE